jgi:signal transduction histidine kinase
VNKPFSWLRPLAVPAVLVALAIVLTVPWSYLVLKAAYDRDVTENARALAHRVEIQRSFTLARPGDPLFTLMEPARDKAMADVLRTEIKSDPSVQTLIFFSILYLETPIRGAPPSALIRPFIIRQHTTGPDEQSTTEEEELAKASRRIDRLTHDQLLTLRNQGIIRIDEASSKIFLIPWVHEGKLQGATYVELSNDALSTDFWKKEWALFLQVIAWSTSGILALSAVGIFAYRVWQKAGHVQKRAELAKQGMLAERGLTAAVLAHEIRNPLQALRFQLHSLRKNVDDPQRVSGTAETIDSELLRIQQLVTDYLEHERAASLRVQSVDLQEAALGLKTVMEELLRDRETRLTINSPDKPVLVTCDPHALRQILMNLVLNAQQAMGRGGSITLRIGRDDVFGTMDLTDTGPGIPPEMLSRLFKPFQSSKKEGHGIGLALVKRFVDNFGGSVTVDSEPGKGTTFHLRLPLAGTEIPQEGEKTVGNEAEVQKVNV